MTPVTAAGQDIGSVDDQGSVGGRWSQVTGTARPTYEIGPARRVYDPDDALPRTLPAISGGQIVIISPAGTWIDSFDFAGGTFTVGPNTYTGGPAGLMSLLGGEEIEIIILPTPMTESERAKMVSYAQGLGSAGEITESAELFTNATVAGTNATNTATIFADGVYINQVDGTSFVEASLNTGETIAVGEIIRLRTTNNITTGSFKTQDTSWGSSALYEYADGSGDLLLKASSESSRVKIYRATIPAEGEIRNVSITRLVLP